MPQNQSCSDPSNVTGSQQRMMTNSQDNSSHLLQKSQQNFCINNDEEQLPVSSIIDVNFHRYSKGNDKRLSDNSPSKRGNDNRHFDNGQSKQESKDSLPSANRALSKTADLYVDWKVYKNKPDINMLPFPYCIEEAAEYKKPIFSPLSLLNPFRPQTKQPDRDMKKQQALPKIYKLQVENKVKLYTGCEKENKSSKPYFNFEKTPINEYLNYELAEQINTGLRDVQIMAEEIKRIKRAKKVANQDDLTTKEKYSKGLRIKRSYIKNFKGLYKTNTNV